MTGLLQIKHHVPALLVRFAVIMVIGALGGVLLDNTTQSAGRLYYELSPRENYFTYVAVVPVEPVFAGAKEIKFDSYVDHEAGLDFSYLENIWCDIAGSDGIVRRTDISGATTRYVRNEMDASSSEVPRRWILRIKVPDTPGSRCWGKAIPEVLLPYGVKKKQVVSIREFILQEKP